MDLQQLSNYLRELLIDNDRVSLFGIGSFVAENAPAFFSGDGKTLFPPSRKLTFRQQESWDDGMIAYLHQRKTSRDLADVQRELADYAKQLRMELQVKKSLLIPTIGELKETKEGNIYFVVDAQLDIDTEGVGLHTIPVRVLDQNRAAVRERARQMQELLKEAEKKESAEVIEEAEQPETNVDKSQPALDEQPQLQPVLEDEEKKMNTRKRNVVWLVWILVLLIVALTLFLFWPSLEAVFEGWLYSEEELRLIQSRP